MHWLICEGCISNWQKETRVIAKQQCYVPYFLEQYGPRQENMCLRAYAKYTYSDSSHCLFCGLFYEAICFKSCLVLFCSCGFSPFSVPFSMGGVG